LAGSFARLLRVDPGFDPRNVLTARVTLPIGDTFRPDRDGPAWSAFFDQLMPRFEEIPGVVAAGATSALPLDGEMESSDVSIDGEPPPTAGQPQRTQYVVVAGHYFQTLAIPLVAGRAFDSRDRGDGQPVVIVNRAFVRQYLAGRDPMAVRLNSGWDFKPTVRQIVGVVADSREGSLEEDPQPTAYVPEAQMTYPALSLVVRVKGGNSVSVLPLVRAQVAALQPSVALDNVRPLDAIVRRSMARERFSLVVVGAFAVCALILALVGLYGVIALGVRQRQRELGVRLALGARPSDVRGLVLVDGAQVTLVGIVFGLLSAGLLTRFMRTLLYGLSATDPSLFVTATVLVAAVAGCAILLPAVRATKIDPVMSLRAE
jgi:putative ABC transport system permease protein